MTELLKTINGSIDNKKQYTLEVYSNATWVAKKYQWDVFMNILEVGLRFAFQYYIWVRDQQCGSHSNALSLTTWKCFLYDVTSSLS